MGVVRLFFLYAFLSLLCLDDTKTRAINIHRGFPWCFFLPEKIRLQKPGWYLEAAIFFPKKTPKLARCFLQHLRQPEVQQCGHVFSIEVSLIKVHRKTCRGRGKTRMFGRFYRVGRWCLKAPTLPETHIFAPEKKVVWSKMETRQSSEASIFRCEELLVSGRVAPMKPDTTFHSPKIPSKKSLPKDLTILRGVSKKCWLFFFFANMG